LARWDISVGKDIGTEREEFGPNSVCGKEAEIGLTESDKRRDNYYGVCWELMGLYLEPI
jgi:hypothetical protein